MGFSASFESLAMVLPTPLAVTPSAPTMAAICVHTLAAVQQDLPDDPRGAAQRRLAGGHVPLRRQLGHPRPGELIPEGVLHGRGLIRARAEPQRRARGVAQRTAKLVGEAEVPVFARQPREDIGVGLPEPLPGGFIGQPRAAGSVHGAADLADGLDGPLLPRTQRLAELGEQGVDPADLKLDPLSGRELMLGRQPVWRHIPLRQPAEK
jgi:hypothetical protein